MKHRWFAGLCVCGTFAWAPACSDDEPVDGSGGSGGSPDAATGGSGGSSGSAGSGGKGGTGGVPDASAGAGGSAGMAGGGGSAGAAGTGGAVSPLNPRSVAVVTPPGGDATAPIPRLLAAGTDYTSKTEVAVIDVGSQTVVERATFADGDAVPAASGGVGFVLERTNDRVHVIGPDGKIARSIDMHAAPTGAAVAGGKAYVLLYATNAIAVVDLDNGSVSKHIDLSAFQASGDSDAAVDMDDVVFDATTDRAYVALGRIDRNTIAAPSFELGCPSWNALVIGINTTTDAIVDLNGALSGNAVELSLVSPAGIHLDTAQNRLIVLSSGCMAPGDGGSVRMRHGVEAVNLASGTASLLLSPINDDFLSRLILIGESEALVNTFDALYIEHWYRWTLGSNALGPELADVPAAPSFDGSGTLLGIRFGSPVDVVRYPLAGGATTTVVSNPWTGSYSSAGGTALVR